MKETKKFWVKERHNPQLGVYFTFVGQLTKSEAKRHERSLHGFNIMHPFNSEVDCKNFMRHPVAGINAREIIETVLAALIAAPLFYGALVVVMLF